MSSQSSLHAPLLRPRFDETSRAPILALLLGNRRCRGPSMMVWKTAARELEERRTDWGYSRPVVALDVTWNMAFVVVSTVMLGCSFGEKPNTAIRLWICGYVVQCLVHVVLVWLEYRRKRGGGKPRRLRDEEFGSEEDDLHDDDDDDEVNDSENDDFDGSSGSGNFSPSM